MSLQNCHALLRLTAHLVSDSSQPIGKSYWLIWRGTAHFVILCVSRATWGLPKIRVPCWGSLYEGSSYLGVYLGVSLVRHLHIHGQAMVRAPRTIALQLHECLGGWSVLPKLNCTQTAQLVARVLHTFGGRLVFILP